MLILALALALQSGPPLLQDPVFLAAHEAWAGCTDRVVDAEFASARSADEIATAALAACTASRKQFAPACSLSGETRGRADMATLIHGNREGLADRVNQRRRAAAATGAPLPQDYRTASLAWMQCTKDRVDATPRGGRDSEVIDGAFAACTAEEATFRAAAARMLGNDTQPAHLMSEARDIARRAIRRYLRRRR